MMRKLCRIVFSMVIIFWAGFFLSVDYCVSRALAQDSGDSYIYDYHDKLIDSLAITNPGSQRGPGVSDPLGQGGLSTDSIGFPATSDIEEEDLDIGEYYLPEEETDSEYTEPVDIMVPESPATSGQGDMSDKQTPVRESPAGDINAKPAAIKPYERGKSSMSDQQLKEYEKRVKEMLDSSEYNKKSP